MSSNPNYEQPRPKEWGNPQPQTDLSKPGIILYSEPLHDIGWAMNMVKNKKKVRPHGCQEYFQGRFSKIDGAFICVDLMNNNNRIFNEALIYAWLPRTDWELVE